MPDPLQISEAINNSVGFYLWTSFTIRAIETLFGMSVIIGAGYLIWKSVKYLTSLDD